MTFTALGAIVLVIGLWVLIAGSMTAVLIFLIATTLLGGSALSILSGNINITPTNLGTLILAIRCLLPGNGRLSIFLEGLKANIYFVLFAIYGVLGALFLPIYFKGILHVTSLRPAPSKALLNAGPLAFSIQNITTSIYILSTLIGCIGTYAIIRRKLAVHTIVKACIIICIINAVLGFASIIFANTPLNQILLFFRNGFFAQLNQSFDGFVRMAGIFPEPASYAAYTFIWLVFMNELWVRDIEPRWTGFALLLTFSALMISTSTTAYVGIFGYGIVFLLRLLFTPRALAGRKTLSIIIYLMIATAMALITFLVEPKIFNTVSRVLDVVIVSKSQTTSGVQRAFWARQGLDAFYISHGLGIGNGSFRSSSIILAILGGSGVVGIFTFSAQLWRIFKPTLKATYGKVTDPQLAVGVAASWVAVFMLIPAAFSASSPDPGIVWGIFAGMALALRRAPTSDIKTSHASDNRPNIASYASRGAQ